MKRKFLVDVQYDGKNYFGFQKNGKSKTIEQEIENALYKLFNKTISIEACSRTDRGVSAKKFYFAFVCETKLPQDRICFKLNRFLPKDIQCQNSYEIPLDFILRRNIESKTYEYTIYTGKHIKPLLAKNAVFIEGELDVSNMQKCAKILFGKHNFKSFCNINDDTTTFERTIFNIQILQDNEYIKMYFTADNFLYNMARILAGTMVLCGQNKLSENDINNLLKIEDRSKNPAITMQEKGLKLFDIKLKNMPKY